MSFTEALNRLHSMTIKKVLVMTHMHINNETFHVLEIANEAHRLSFAT